MQLKDVTPIIKAILEERDKIPLIIDQERYIPNPQPYHDGNFMRGGIRKALRVIEQAPVVDAVPVVRCRECKHWSGRNDKPGEVTAIGYCNHPNHQIMPLRADWFCADGEKMDGGAADV